MTELDKAKTPTPLAEEQFNKVQERLLELAERVKSNGVFTSQEMAFMLVGVGKLQEAIAEIGEGMRGLISFYELSNQKHIAEQIATVYNQIRQGFRKQDNDVNAKDNN